MYETGVAVVIQPHYNVDVLYPASRMHLDQYKTHQLHWGDSGMYTSDKLHSIYASLYGLFIFIPAVIQNAANNV